MRVARFRAPAREGEPDCLEEPMAGIGIWQLLIVLVIVLLLFGTKKLKNLGGDLGGAIRGFKSAMKDGSDPEAGAEESGDAARIEKAAETEGQAAASEMPKEKESA